MGLWTAKPLYPEENNDARYCDCQTPFFIIFSATVIYIALQTRRI